MRARGEAKAPGGTGARRRLGIDLRQPARGRKAPSGKPEAEQARHEEEQAAEDGISGEQESAALPAGERADDGREQPEEAIDQSAAETIHAIKGASPIFRKTHRYLSRFDRDGIVLAIGKGRVKRPDQTRRNSR